MLKNVTKVKSAPYTAYQFELMGENCVIIKKDDKCTLFTSCGDTMMIDGKEHVFWRGDDQKDFRQLYAIVEAFYSASRSQCDSSKVSE